MLKGAGFDFFKFYAGTNDDCVLQSTLYSEGGPRHDSFPGGHSVFAGSTIASLSAMFCMYEDEDICLGIVPADESIPPVLKLWDDFQVYGEGVITGVRDEALEFLFRDIQDEVFFDDDRLSPMCTGTKIVLDFEYLPEGQISEVSVGSGITVLSPPGSMFEGTVGIFADSNSIAADVNAATIFDGACLPQGSPSGCTGGDPDLFFPAQGKILIINEDTNFGHPDDSANGGVLTLDFSDLPGRIDVEKVTVLDNEVVGASFFDFDTATDGILTVPLTTASNNGAAVQLLDQKAVTGMTVRLGGSMAIDDITLCVTPQADIVREIWEGDIDGTKGIPNRLVETALDATKVTVWYEMVKWAQQYTHARDRAGVHYWSDGCTGLALGEIMTIRYIIADLSIRPQAALGETIIKPLMDGRNVVITAAGVRLFGSTDPPSLDVNFLVTDDKPLNCGNFIPPIPMNEEVPVL